MSGVSVERARPMMMVLLTTYLVILVWLVLWKLHTPFVGSGVGTIKLIPFVRTEAAGSSAPLEVFGNVAVFVPFGIYLGLLGRSSAKALAVIALTSAALEATQYVLGVGVTDITDVIANTLGGALGLGVVALIGRGSVPQTVLRSLCVVGTALALLALAVHVAAPPQPMPPL